MGHLLGVNDLTNEQVRELMTLARRLKEGEEVRVRGRAVLFFAEPSTRTRLSFEAGARRAGLEVQTVNAHESSAVKGESFYDTLRTLEALGADFTVFRVPFVLWPYGEVTGVKSALINAGDGTREHPTQALVDLFTLLERLGSVEGLRVLFVGDVKYSRVFRSERVLLERFGARVGVCGPATLIPRGLEGVELFYELDEALGWADAVVWLRLQRERQKEKEVPSLSSYFKLFGLTRERYKRVKLFLHPGPVNANVDVEEELIYAPKSLVAEQVRNGPFVRAALFALLKSW
ncbi:MAG: aspartate carbamoyltransferase catalytic subunit [Aquificae bacterium]|nr:aspartate carbamoyltransferase catalytic subunit [Aquificota bacterium]